MKKIILFSVLELSASSSAFAFTAQSGAYISGNFGWSFPSTWSNESVAASTHEASVTQSNRGVTAGAGLGYNYALNQNFMLGGEANYVYFGGTRYDLENGVYNLNTAESAVQLLMTATYLNQNGLNFFAKAGAAYMMENVDKSINIWIFNFNNQNSDMYGWEPVIALGTGYMLNPSLNLTLQYQHVFGDNNSNITSTTRPQSENTVTVGLTYLFGNTNTNPV